MAINIFNYRQILKRSSVTGVQPTIPGSGVTNLYDSTEGGWLDTDLYNGEMFLNVPDKKVWIRAEDEILLLGYSGMTSDFIDLGDTPSGYTGYAGYSVVVNGIENGLEFQQIVPVNNFTDLLDTPASYTGSDGYIVTVDEANSALTFTNPSSLQGLTLNQITDFPPYISGSTGNVLVLNATADGLEWTSFDASVSLQDATDNGATTDNIISYVADYSGSYTDRSLVDKEYVDDADTVLQNNIDIVSNNLLVLSGLTGAGDLQAVLDNGSTYTDANTEITLANGGYQTISSTVDGLTAVLYLGGDENAKLTYTDGTKFTQVSVEVNNASLYTTDGLEIGATVSSINVNSEGNSTIYNTDGTNVSTLTQTPTSLEANFDGNIVSFPTDKTGTIALLSDITDASGASIQDLQSVLDNGSTATLTDTNFEVTVDGYNSINLKSEDGDGAGWHGTLDMDEYGSVNIKSTNLAGGYGQVYISTEESNLVSLYSTDGTNTSTITTNGDGSTVLTNTDGTNTSTLTQTPFYNIIETFNAVYSGDLENPTFQENVYSKLQAEAGHSFISAYTENDKYASIEARSGTEAGIITEPTVQCSVMNTTEDVTLTISTEENQTVFEDNRTVQTGIEYDGDYSSTFTDRSLVDKAYVDSVAGGGGTQDLQSVLDEGNTSIQTSQVIYDDGANGNYIEDYTNETNISSTDVLISTSYDGYYDGTGTEPTVHETYNTEFTQNADEIKLSTNAGTTTAYIGCNGGVANVMYSEDTSSGEYTYINNDPRSIILELHKVFCPTYRFSLEYDDTAVFWNDNTFKGIEYKDDYSANYTDRTLVDAGNVMLKVAAPASASSTGNPGQIAYDSSYVYVCISTDTWKRSPLSTW